MEIEQVPISSLKPHPRNYRKHPADQLAHLVHSLKEHGFYRNVIIAKDDTILAGHGIIEAARSIGLKDAPCIRLPYAHDSVQALKVLAGDNELWHLSENDDRMLTDMLKEIKELSGDGLIGTGFDDMMLAGLALITRPEEELKDINEAAHWVGMPTYAEGNGRIQLVINFQSEFDRLAFLRLIEYEYTGDEKAVKSIWWPFRERRDRLAEKIRS